MSLTDWRGGRRGRKEEGEGKNETRPRETKTEIQGTSVALAEESDRL